MIKNKFGRLFLPFIFLFPKVHAAKTSSDSPSIRLVVVHSYHSGFPWTEALEEGFTSKLSKFKRIEVVQRFYLDSKRKPKNISRTAESVLTKLRGQNFDLVFLTDDDAMKNVGRSLVNAGYLTVFAGLNGAISSYGLTFGKESDENGGLPRNVAGVMESYPLNSLLQLIRKLHPNATNLNLFSDESETSRSVMDQFKSEIGQTLFNKFQLRVASKVFSNNMRLWEKALVGSNPATDVNLIFPFSNIRGSKVMRSEFATPESLAFWIVSKSKTPEYATASLMLKFPFFATVGIRGTEHGEDAAEAAKLLIEGSPKGRLIVGRYARLNFNLLRARELRVQVPLELLSYSYSLQSNQGKK